MSFNLQIQLDTSQLEDGAKTSEDKLNQVADASDKANASLKTMGTAGASAAGQVAESLDLTVEASQRAVGGIAELDALVKRLGADVAGGGAQMAEWEGMLAAGSSSLERQAQVFERIRGPIREYNADVEALGQLLDRGKINVAEYDTELERLNKQAGVMQGPLSQIAEREAAALQRIRGPMEEYRNQVATLQRLMAQGQITADEYNAELGKQAQRAGVIPQQQQQQKQQPGQLDDAIKSVAPQFGAGGQLIGGLVTQGTVAIATVVALAHEVTRLRDAYVEISNEAIRFANNGQSVDQVLQQQLALSQELHTSVQATLGLYASVREGTDDLNLSSAEQIRLTKEIGDGVIASGKSADEAASLMRRLSFAMAAGTIQGRELRQIMREFPALGDGFVQAMGKSRQELLAMANKGQISSQMLIDAFNKMGPALEAQVGQHAETTGQMWQHFTDQLTLSFGKFAEQTGLYKALGDGLDALGKGIAGLGEIAAMTSGQFKLWADQMRYTIEMYKELGAGLGNLVGDSAVFQKLNDMDPSKQVADEGMIAKRTEALKLLNGELQKNADTAKIADAAAKAGVAFAAFDQALADAEAPSRSLARVFGIELSDSFAAAHNQATLFGAKIKEMEEQHASARIAEDVKRIYEVMYGADDLMHTQLKRWTDISDQIKVATEALNRWRASAPDGANDPWQRDVARQIQQQQLELDNATYGKATVSFQQGKAQAKNDLEDLRRAIAAGRIEGDAARKEYESLMTTLNNGRLPEVIKQWDELHLPQQQFVRDQQALNELLAKGAITLGQYAVQLHKLEDSFDNSGLLKMIRENNDAFAVAAAGPKHAQSADFDAYQAQVAHDSLIGTKMADLDKEYKFPEENDLEKDLAAWDKRAEAVNANLKAIDPLLYYQNQHQLQLQAEKKILEDINGQPMKDYELGLKAVADLHNKLTPEQYAQAIDKIRIAYLSATPAGKTFTGALELELLKLKQQSESLGATLATTLVGDVQKLSDSFIDMLNNGKVSFSSLIDSMVTDIEKLIAKALEAQAVAALFPSLFSSGTGGSVGVSVGGLAGAVLSGAGSASTGASIGDAIGGAAGAAAVARSAPSGPGAYPLPTTGGASSSAAIAATPQVTVHVHNHYSDDLVHGAIDSPAGEKVVMNVLRRNANAVRSYSGSRKT